jgi:hypothetical protein
VISAKQSMACWTRAQAPVCSRRQPNRQPVTVASHASPAVAADRSRSVCTYEHADPLPVNSTVRTEVRRCESEGTHVSVIAWACDRYVRWCKAMEQPSPAVDSVFRSTAQHSMDQWHGPLCAVASSHRHTIMADALALVALVQRPTLVLHLNALQSTARPQMHCCSWPATFTH